MLVLSRKLGESIIIGNDIEIRIVKLDRGQVRIGITAPSHVGVYRSEIFDANPTEASRAIIVKRTIS